MSNNPNFNKTGENHPVFGRTLSAEAKAKLSELKIGKNLSTETKAKMSLVRKGVAKTEEHKANISKSMYKKVFVYSSSTPTILHQEFISCSEAAKHFSCHVTTITKYLKSGQVFKEKWILSNKSENK